MIGALIACATVLTNGGVAMHPAVQVVTPEQLEEAWGLARMKERRDFTVRFWVRSAAPASGTAGGFVLEADAKFKDLYQGEGRPTQPSRDLFRVELSPKAEAELAKAGVADLKEHFAAREVEVRGTVEAMDYWCFPVVRVYMIRVGRAEQIRVVR